MKLIRVLLLIVTGFAIGFGGLMFWKAWKSQKMSPNVGVINGKLKICGEKPNCVSSFSEVDNPSYIEPLKPINIEIFWDNLNIYLTENGFKVVNASSQYIHATESTPLLKFVDDIEFLLDEAQGIIHMRSASRVGYSDMGANRKRLIKIKEALEKL